MHKLRLFVYCIMLATTPTLLACPQNTFPQVSNKKANRGYMEETREWVRPTTYDEVMQMLEDLESGELEKKYSPLQLERVNSYLATLAKEGILPDEFGKEIDLEDDTYELMYGEDSAFQLANYLENSNDYMIIPAVLDNYSSYDIVQCGKISKAWKKTKKFAKKHKKAIIIGAVVVVAVTVVTVAVVAASSASAATAAGAAGAAAGAGSGPSKSKQSKTNRESSRSAANSKDTPAVDVNEAPQMKETIDEHMTSFKEFLVEDKAAQQEISSKNWDEMAFSEKARELGSNASHRALDDISDLVKVVPQLCDEVKELGARFLPDGFTPPINGEIGSTMGNYENIVANGHKVIDNVFSTDQAELFTAESKANDSMNNFAIGMLPSPLSGSLTQVFSDTKRFKEAGKVLDRKGLTKAGRGLIKHGNREGSVFPRPFGNTAEMNKRGQIILEEILNDPKNRVYQFSDGSLKVYSSNGRGVIYKKDGSFKGFIEWQYE